MSVEKVTVVPQCADCGHVWMPSEGECWRCTFDTDAKLLFYCAECAEREFEKDSVGNY